MEGMNGNPYMAKAQEDLQRSADELQMDLLGGLRDKKKGMNQAALPKSEVLELCRDEAERICRRQGTVTSDDVRRALNLAPVGTNQQNWIGSIFKDKRFVSTGEMVKSTIRRNHGRLLTVWRLAP